jgi:uncharacterized protein YndB with AHSA1/START domain
LSADKVTGSVAGRKVSEVRFIPAPRQRLFDLVADPSQHPRIDGSGTVQAQPDGGPERLGPGVRFGMSMRMGLPYRTSNRVVEFEEGVVVAWSHFSRAVWRWEFRDVEGGTEVTETFDWSGARVPAFMRRFAAGNQQSMRRSLERLEQLAAGGR